MLNGMRRRPLVLAGLVLGCGLSDQDARCHEACFSISRCEQGPNSHHAPRDFDECFEDCTEREWNEPYTDCISTHVICNDVFACTEVPPI